MWKIHNEHHTHGDRLKFFLLRLGKKQRCPLLPLILHIVLEDLESTITQEKTEVIQIENKKVKLSLFTDNMVCVEILKIPNIHTHTLKPIRHNKQIQQNSSIQSQDKKSVAFLFP